MPTIKWDESGEHIYETGADHGILFPTWTPAVGNTAGYFTGGVAWNGLSAVNETPSGAEPTSIWADNIKYLTLLSAEEYGCTIEAFTAPPEFAECDGSAMLGEGTGLKIGQQERKIFAFAYRTLVGNDTEGNAHGFKLHIVYNCKASPTERNHATVNDSPEAQQMSWNVTTTPVPVTGFKPTATVEIDNISDPEGYAIVEAKLISGDCPLPDELLALVAA